METYSYGLPWEMQSRWETCSWKASTWGTWTATPAPVASGADEYHNWTDIFQHLIALNNSQHQGLQLESTLCSCRRQYYSWLWAEGYEEGHSWIFGGSAAALFFFQLRTCHYWEKGGKIWSQVIYPTLFPKVGMRSGQRWGEICMTHLNCTDSSNAQEYLQPQWQMHHLMVLPSPPSSMSCPQRARSKCPYTWPVTQSKQQDATSLLEMPPFSPRNQTPYLPKTHSWLVNDPFSPLHITTVS